MTTAQRARPVLGFLAVAVFILITWELAKLLAGDPWRAGDQVVWQPPLSWKPVNDLNLPHLWTIAAAFLGRRRGRRDLHLVTRAGRPLHAA